LKLPFICLDEKRLKKFRLQKYLIKEFKYLSSFFCNLIIFNQIKEGEDVIMQVIHYFHIPSKKYRIRGNDNDFPPSPLPRHFSVSELSKLKNIWIG